uniref:CNH domain-containing protein n=1 Tax=Strigamia maritima TaxID=126957 RepID=T1J6Q4_STRMM
MYFPIGWPKYLTIPQDKQTKIKHIACHRDKIIFAVITEDSVAIWFSKPCVQILSYRRSFESIELFGVNCSAEWKPDCSALATVTSKDNIIFYMLDIDLSRSKFLYEQRDSKVASLKRETAELFIRESIRPLSLTEALNVSINGGISRLTSVRDELVVTTRDGCLESLNWDGTLNYNYSFLLSTIPFSTDQQHSRASAIDEIGVYVTDIEFCPILSGFSIVLSDGRAAFLSLEPDQFQGIWAQEVHDATCTAINHKYKLIAFGRKSKKKKK